ncbi:MAG TPA: lanthionine synthetase LanC family protein [Streptosporangiaceae bacterium]|nr:lanthionine synthetase LanC family protein [Streptosporangiaceae bacterium]
MRTTNTQLTATFDVAVDALRWVAEAAVAADGGATWPLTRRPGAATADDLYDGTAGVLMAFAQARLSGITRFDEPARAAAGRLRYLARSGWMADPAGQVVYLAGRPAELARRPAELARRPAELARRPTDVTGRAEDEREAPDLSLYVGLSGIVTALRTWADVAGDAESGDAAGRLVSAIARSAGSEPDAGVRDLLEGDAGVLATLVAYGGDDARPAASLLADRLVGSATWADGQPDWPAAATGESGEPREPGGLVSKPNFSHGAAGIAFALAAASGPLRRPDLLEVAAAAGERLIRLGTRPDGTLAVPYRLPADRADHAGRADQASQADQADPAKLGDAAGHGGATHRSDTHLTELQPQVSYGWCHGPVGTLRLFELLDRLQPGRGWGKAATACRRAVRGSGLPARLYPGFWDNLGQCCGTAGVGEMALDRFQDTTAAEWLSWADDLAEDVVNRRFTDGHGTRWSHTEHRAEPPELPPAVGWMQGAAGIAGWLLRLARVHADGPRATRLSWPDRP